MLLHKYLQTINNVNPNKIYVENVRSFFKVPSFLAKLMCEMAVIDNVFVKKIGVVCPNSDCKRIIETFDSFQEIPETITCDICENEERIISTYKTANLEKIEFYKLNKATNE